MIKDQAEIVLDHLISHDGETLVFDKRSCPISLLKKVILRGFQVCHFGEIFLEGSGQARGKVWGSIGIGCGASIGKMQGLQTCVHTTFRNGGGFEGSGNGSGYGSGAEGWSSLYSRHEWKTLPYYDMLKDCSKCSLDNVYFLR